MKLVAILANKLHTSITVLADKFKVHEQELQLLISHNYNNTVYIVSTLHT